MEHLKVEYCKSEKCTRFLRISEFRHFFQILKIPLLCTPDWHAKWINLCCLNFTQILTAPDREKMVHFVCSQRALRNGILQIWKKCKIPEDISILARSDPQNSASKGSKLTCTTPACQLGVLGSGVSPSAKIVYLENIGFVYSAMSMMVIGPSLLY